MGRQVLHEGEAEVTLLDTGHFALETHAVEITAAIRRFLAAHPPA